MSRMNQDSLGVTALIDSDEVDVGMYVCICLKSVHEVVFRDLRQYTSSS